MSVPPALAGTDEWSFVGPLGGSIVSIAVNQGSCDSIYAVTGGCLYVTGGLGSSWERVAAAPADMIEIYIDPERSETLFGIAVYRLYKSTDAGMSWTELTAFVQSFTFNPQNSSCIYAGSRDGILRKSVDGGSSWTDLHPAVGGDVTAVAVCHADTGKVYVGMTGDYDIPGWGIFKSTDGGQSWFPADSLIPPCNIQHLIIDLVAQDKLYAGTTGTGMYPGHGVWRSTNGGVSWEDANTGLPSTYPTSVWMLEAVPWLSGNLYVSMGTSSLYYTENAGVSWTETDLGLDPAGVISLGLCPQETDAFYTGTEYGLMKMASWYDKAALIGVVPAYISAVAADPDTPDILYAGGYTMYRSENAGSSWEIMNEGLGILHQGCKGIVIDYSNTDVIYTGHYYNGSNLYKSVNGAATWDICLADKALNDIVIDPHGHDTLYTGGLAEVFVGGLFKTNNSGGSWSKVDTSVIMSIAIDPVNPGVVYTGTSREGVKKSVNGGAAWAFVNYGLPESSVSTSFLHAVAVDPVNPDIVYCSLSGEGVFKSYDGGGMWSEANSGLPYLDVRDIEVDYLRPSILYAGIYGHGVYMSINGGRNWESMNLGLPTGLYVNVEIDPVYPNILHGCSSAGLYRYVSSFDPTTDDEVVPGQGGSGAVIRGSTIEYSLELPCHVQMKVYDVAGRVVASLIDRRQSAGQHSVVINSDRLSSGVYFVKMNFGDRSVTKKYILIR